MRDELAVGSCRPSAWASPVGMAGVEHPHPLKNPDFAERALLATVFVARAPVQTRLVVPLPLLRQPAPM